MAIRSLDAPTLFRLVALALAISTAMGWLIHPANSASQNLADGIRGLFLGVALALFVLVSRRSRFGQRRS